METRAQRLGGYSYERTPACYVVGAGSRGAGYVQISIEDPTSLRVTGVAEPQRGRREDFAKQHGLENPMYVTDDWKPLLAAPKEADFVLVATQDADHAEPAIAFMKAGFHVLVEKPMATKVEDCVEMVRVAEEMGVMLGVCHVLRYTPYTRKIKQIIDSGKIGDVRSVNLVEPVGNWHFAHSYVRGAWRNTKISSFVLMAKSCHDIDWLSYVVGMPMKTVLCDGKQMEFKKASKPEEAMDAVRCVDCAYANECPYDAQKIYTGRAVAKGVNNDMKTRVRFPIKALFDDPNVFLQDVEDAVATGPFGRCVYECDNDQPDVVSAIIGFEDPESGKAAQVTFEMRALTDAICKREVTICGTKGEIRGDMEKIDLTVFDGYGEHDRQTHTPTTLTRDDTLVSGHWGADWFLMNAWCAAVSKNDPSLILSGPHETLESHLAVFAAEEARLDGRKVSVQDFVRAATHSSTRLTG